MLTCLAMTVELKTRQVTSDFINSFQEKLVYVGEPGETSEEFEKITNKWVIHHHAGPKHTFRIIYIHIFPHWHNWLPAVNIHWHTEMSRSRRWRHIDMTGMKMPRWSLTVMSKMVFLHTLVLDSCELEWVSHCLCYIISDFSIDPVSVPARWGSWAACRPSPRCVSTKTSSRITSPRAVWVWTLLYGWSVTRQQLLL